MALSAKMRATLKTNNPDAEAALKTPAKPTGRQKGPDAFRTIGEAAAEIGEQTHVLRFWETKFSRLKPLTRAGGRRYYRPEDIALLKTIKRLLHDDGMTIRGAQKILQGRQTPDLLDAFTPAGGTAVAKAMPSESAPAPMELRQALAALAAEARSVANGGPIPPISGND